MMLALKDNVDVEELKQYGFEHVIREDGFEFWRQETNEEHEYVYLTVYTMNGREVYGNNLELVHKLVQARFDWN